MTFVDIVGIFVGSLHRSVVPLSILTVIAGGAREIVEGASTMRSILPAGRFLWALVTATSWTTVFAQTVSLPEPATAQPQSMPAIVAPVVVDSLSLSRADLPAWTPAETPELGTAVSVQILNASRGGSEVHNAILPNGVVQDNQAIQVVTGSNAIREGSFSNASGIPVVIQNTGANVLIQNATIVNVQLR